MSQWGKQLDGFGQGTTPEACQQIIASLYQNANAWPVLALHGDVIGNADRTFRVPAGAGVYPTAAGAVWVCWQATKTALVTPPASGTQDWTVYVDEDGAVQVGPGAQTGIILGSFPVPAGATSMAGIPNKWNMNYALAYGASLGILLNQSDVSTQLGGNLVVCGGMFFLPTDRMVQIQTTTSLMACAAGTGGVVDQGSAYVRTVLDGKQYRECEYQLSGHSVTVNQFSDWVTLEAGAHTVSMGIRDGISGWKRFYSDRGWPGQNLVVRDAGMAQ